MCLAFLGYICAYASQRRTRVAHGPAATKLSFCPFLRENVGHFVILEHKKTENEKRRCFHLPPHPGSVLQIIVHRNHSSFWFKPNLHGSRVLLARSASALLQRQNNRVNYHTATTGMPNSQRQAIKQLQAFNQEDVAR